RRQAGRSPRDSRGGDGTGRARVGGLPAQRDTARARARARARLALDRAAGDRHRRGRAAARALRPRDARRGPGPPAPAPHARGGALRAARRTGAARVRAGARSDAHRGPAGGAARGAPAVMALSHTLASGVYALAALSGLRSLWTGREPRAAVAWLLGAG